MLSSVHRVGRVSTPNHHCNSKLIFDRTSFQKRWNSQTNSPQEKKITDYERDHNFNVPDNVAKKIGRNLHLNPLSPINILKKRMENYFLNTQHGLMKPGETFRSFDTFAPFVTVRENFDLLQFPDDHVGRNTSDSYYINQNTLLRTHMTAHQNELLRSGERAFIVSGDVFRRDEIDAKHYPVFHQMDGVKVFDPEILSKVGDKDAQLQAVIDDMKATLDGMVKELLGSQNTQARWIDGQFPFTHPSFEMEVFYNDDWLEILGCGVIHPKIMEANGLGDCMGWAFGIGLERVAMTLFNIPDIRLFWSDDERFLNQFKSGQVVQFVPYSKYPPTYMDISFWKNRDFHANDLNEVIRDRAGDIVESVIMQSEFKHPKTGRMSQLWRINYRSMDRILPVKEINGIQEQVRKDLVEKFDVELR